MDDLGAWSTVVEPEPAERVGADLSSGDATAVAGTGLRILAAHQIASQPAARSRASMGRSPAWTPWVAVSVTSTTPFGMASTTSRPMASTTSRKARILRCVPRRDGISMRSERSETVKISETFD
jgi:hypothetical protein